MQALTSAPNIPLAFVGGKIAGSIVDGSDSLVRIKQTGTLLLFLSPSLSVGTQAHHLSLSLSLPQLLSFHSGDGDTVCSASF